MYQRAFLVMILMGFIMTACGQKQETSVTKESQSNVNQVTVNSNKSDEKSKENDCRICNFDYAVYKGELKKEEIDGLLLALNDEYLAAATYEQVNKDFNNPRPFVNIVEAEKRHAGFLKELFEKYKIAVPENLWAGKTSKFQSVNEACKAGIDGEIANRDLYTKLFKSTTREDILGVYRALQKASEENHLPAFERCASGGPGNGQGGGMRRGNF